MSGVRSHTFITVGAASKQATVPVGRRWLVKYAVWFNQSGSTCTWTFAVIPAGGTQRTLFAGNVSSGSYAMLPQPVTVEAGDIIICASNVATTNVAASGIEFTP